MKRLFFGCLLLAAVACGGSTGSNGTQGDAGDAATASCNAGAVDGILVASVGGGSNPLDPLGYPPYAIDGCTLVYVAATSASGAGALMLRDLGTGAETMLDPASASPRRPSISGDMIAWETKDGVVGRKGGTTYRLAGFAYPAGEPRATDDAIVFTAFLQPHGDSDVYLWIPGDARAPQAIATGPGEQRFADVSATLVAVSDFSEDPTGAFDDARLSLADIVVYDRATLTKTIRHVDGKQAFPMLSRSGQLGYLDWATVHPEPKLSQWALRVGNALSPPAGDANAKGTGTVLTNTPYVRPSVRGAFLEWVDESAGTSALFRRPIDLSAPATTALSGVALLGPVAGESVTVVGTQVNGAISLRGVAR